MAKKPKKKQTEWNIQGKQIADTAAPLWQKNLGRIDKYLANPSAAIDNYLDKYYTNSSRENDFLRAYNRAMSGATANNYMATGGGYDTSNQRNYDDYQRYQNNLASRLRDYGIQSSANMAYKDYVNMLQGNNAYQNAWAMGQPYSDVDQYNYQVKQHNRFGNQLMGLIGGTGQILSTIPTPMTQAIGAGMQAVGNTFGMENTSGLNPNYYMNIAKGIAQTSQYGGDNWITDLAGGRDASGANAIRSEGSTISTGQFVNPNQMTTNYFENNLKKHNIPSKFSWQ